MAKRELKGKFVQVALDVPNMKVQEKVLKALPDSDRLIIEAGTPFIKRYGIDVVKKIRKFFPNAFVLADLKTLDVGRIEVAFSHEAGADAAVTSGLASPLSIDKFLDECNKREIIGVIDLMEVEDPLKKLAELTEKPDVIIFHRGIDTEDGDTDPKAKWKLIPKIKEFYAPDHEVKAAVAGGLNADTASYAIEMGADILIIGRYITGADDVGKATETMINLLKE